MSLDSLSTTNKLKIQFMGLKTSVSISYSSIFNDYETSNIKGFLSDIPSINSLEVIGYFNAQLHIMERDPLRQLDFLKIWLTRLQEEVKLKVEEFLEKILSNPHAEFNLINNVSSLILIEHILENFNYLEKVHDLTPEQELNLFKAYLFCSQIWTDKHQDVLEGKKIQTPEQLIDLLLPIQLPYQEILEFKDFRIQFLEAIYFFNFCESDEIFGNYLKAFLNEYHLESWQKYIINILSIYVRKFDPIRTPSVLEVPEEYPDIISFLDSFSLDPTSYTVSDDFLSLREKPVFKIDNNNFLFLNLNFLVDKIYQGIQFEFSKVLIKQGVEYKEKPIKSFPDFKGIYGDIFSEHGLFYKVLDNLTYTSKFIKLKGIDLKKLLGDGEPDYYIRDKAKVYIFEYKDVLINAKVKHSYEIEEIKSEVFKKLVQNERGKAKGITQLVNVIESIRNNEFSKFDNYDFENVIIYPIIGYTDFSFTLAGMNYILIQEFRKQIIQRNIKNSHLIKDLTLIDLDSLIKFQDLFIERKLKLNNCLNEYHEFRIRSQNLFDKVISFNMFLHNKTMKMDYDSPKMLMEKINSLLA